MPIPFFQILAGGVDVTSRIAGGGISLTITDCVGMKSDSIDLDIDDVDGVIAPPKVGVKLRVIAGYVGDARDFGTFIVDEVTLTGWPQKIAVHAQSADAASALKQRRPKSYQPPEYKTYGDVFSEIAGRNGLTLSMSAEVKEKPIEYEAQSEEEDSSFLTRLGLKLNLAVSFKSGHLVAVKRGAGETASGLQIPQILVRGGDNVLSYSVSDQTKARHKKVKARWYDRKTAKTNDVEAEADDEGPECLIRGCHQSESEAKDAAESMAHDLKRAASKASFEISGNPDARAEAFVIVQKIRSLVDGIWRATQVTHNWSASGPYSTSLECELPNAGRAARKKGSNGKEASSGANSGQSGSGAGGSTGGETPPFDPGNIGGTPGDGPE